MNIRRWAVVALTAWVVPLWLAARNEPDTSGSELSAVSREELLEELKSAPGSNAEREKKLAELYKQAGAKDEDIKLQELSAGGKKVHNVVVTKKGETDRTIVIGGHLDKVAPGKGVIDDWSGACMASNVYQAFKSVKTRHTLVFLGFAAEEIGLVGSSHFVKSLSADEAKKCRAMVNLECLGPAEPHIWTNGSTDWLEKILREVAKEEKIDVKDHVLSGVGADSQSFEKRKIPNITIDGLPKEKFGFIHSDEDRFENVNADHYYNSYRLVIAYIKKLDQLKN